jgi:hypothetical protein
LLNEQQAEAMVTPTKRLTLFLPPKLHQLIAEAARADFARPSEFAKRVLAQHIMAERKPGSDGRREAGRS